MQRSIFKRIHLPLSSPPSAYDIQWSNGNTTNSIRAWAAGTYYVSNSAPCPLVDTFIIRRDFPQWSITINEKILGTSYAFDTYQLHKGEQLIPGATNATYEVLGNGVLTVQVKSDQAGIT